MIPSATPPPHCHPPDLSTISHNPSRSPTFPATNQTQKARADRTSISNKLNAIAIGRTVRV